MQQIQNGVFLLVGFIPRRRVHVEHAGRAEIFGVIKAYVNRSVRNWLLFENRLFRSRHDKNTCWPPPAQLQVWIGWIGHTQSGVNRVSVSVKTRRKRAHRETPEPFVVLLQRL